MRVECHVYRVAGGVERRAKRIANDLKYTAIARLNRPIQNFMMPRQQGHHFIWMLLCEFGASFDVGEEEGDGAGGEVGGHN